MCYNFLEFSFVPGKNSWTMPPKANFFGEAFPQTENWCQICVILHALMYSVKKEIYYQICSYNVGEVDLVVKGLSFDPSLMKLSSIQSTC